jgi:hypothetical protein
MLRYISAALLRNASTLSKKVTAFVVIGKNLTKNEKQKPRQFSLIRLLFGHRENRSLLFVHLLMKKKRKLSIFANGSNGPNGLKKD